RMLYGIERDLEHDLGSNHATVALVLDRHLEKSLRVIGDLSVGEARVRLADVYELPSARVFDREGVVGEPPPPLAVTPLDRGHHHVERRERALELEPGKPAASGRVGAQGILHHQALVSSFARLLEDAVEVRWVGRLLQSSQQEWVL